ncbi:hypothetical protein CXG81DRAFT_20285 [Caulochytrium protostelioides]|uniref:Dynactin subunit 6 n=1 Tax=Caulochytrium protostelioides TaxID=1555241 RepID=A0A4P9X3R5_9FUNG|nr:hypothetical protein CXG81DRAFT_20285 [Caulochytrium protostelioides]|eukprot:RKO99661.1 hypothetical protein CXG81DRAFT_20285 [Caulochytrium protostelioides]
MDAGAPVAAAATVPPRPPFVARDAHLVHAAGAGAGAAASAPITLGPGVVVHPQARIECVHPDATVTLHADTIVEETAVVRHDGAGAMRIGAQCLLEAGATFRGRQMGPACILEPGAAVGRGCVLGARVLVGARARVPRDTVLPDDAVVYGPDGAWRRSSGVAGIAARAGPVLSPDAALTDAAAGTAATAAAAAATAPGLGSRLLLHTRHLQYLHETLPRSHARTEAGPETWALGAA